MSVTVAGGCHCGAVRFSARVPRAAEILECNCSICAKTGFLHLIVPHRDFALHSGDDRLTVYQFGTAVAQHLFCARCGIKSFYQPRSHPDCYSISLRCLDSSEELQVRIAPFDGRDWEAAHRALEKNE